MSTKEPELAENSPQTARTTPRGRPFPPGVSGNPGGRPSMKPFRDGIRRTLAEPDHKTKQSNLAEVVRALVAQAKKGKVDAIRELLDRVDGRVETKVSAKFEAVTQKLDRMTDDELEALATNGALPEWFDTEESKP